MWHVLLSTAQPPQTQGKYNILVRKLNEILQGNTLQENSKPSQNCGKVSIQKGYLSVTLPNPRSLCRKNTLGAEEKLTLLGVLQF